MTDQLAAPDVDSDDAEGPDAGGADAQVDSTAPASDAATPITRGRFGRVPRSQRISKWDRPPDPHDWRFFVGTLGKVLIATGLLLFGFVAYQLWGTGIETARAQNKLENQFEALLAENAGTADSAGYGAASGDQPTADADDGGGDVSGGESSTSDEPASADSDGSGDSTSDASFEADNVQMPVPIDLSDQAVEQDIPKIVRGDVLARLEIPAINQVEYIVPGVSLNDLKKGSGHYPDTPLPGQLGNTAIAGHRTTYGAPFFDVDQLQAGDELIFTMANGDRFVYEVTFLEIVSASDYWVVTTSDPSIAEATLTSCHPKYTARDRIVVHSLLNPDKSSNVGIPTFYELEPDPEAEPIPGDDPTLASDIDVTDQGTSGVDVEPASSDQTGDTGDTDSAVDGDGETGNDSNSDATTGNIADSSTASSDSEGEAVAEDTATARGPEVDPDAPIDAFSQGWFDDRGAFPQIALWGIALTIISLLAYQISKKFRRDSIGFLVGIAPFLIALYFFFQNVNRLLPPGI